MGWVDNATRRWLYPRERPGTHCIGGWVGRQDRYGRVRKISPTPGFFKTFILKLRLDTCILNIPSASLSCFFLFVFPPNHDTPILCIVPLNWCVWGEGGGTSWEGWSPTHLDFRPRGGLLSTVLIVSHTASGWLLDTIYALLLA
jgi:hypothetical protein